MRRAGEEEEQIDSEKQNQGPKRLLKKAVMEQAMGQAEPISQFLFYMLHSQPQTGSDPRPCWGYFHCSQG